VASIRRAAEGYPALQRALVTVVIVVGKSRLLSRIKRRGQDDEAEVARRMATAEKELLEARKFDFIIESGTRDEDFAALLAILEAARRRAFPS